ncbi:hypothetical protein ACEPXJ_25345 [Pseudomonas aeruginosa]|uniref:hypothetical protein n=1 Tax=Pseudomonas aeruginosa TaxID=287 RepID=UPI000FF831CC|nr:hypothetical protein [Pseudomonas aeruginosa]MBG4750666.1 hypothetical protein [Pseudomonas aeruginosa]RWX94772.1 hypothetical protein EQH71_29175 [Pseudomonas aeruginosa]HBN8247412.1 hypothetical protein [Pseudomonas aeruginosa]HBN8402465.1 hypothetical protein [Pseudomonas aeruginosa]HCF3332977.1 hypothetical protein [Pseudomonas aeruginosa]
MSTLIQTCGQLRVGLQNAKIANQTRQEISALQQRLREWGRHAETRQTLMEKVRIVDPSILVREDIAQADCNVKGLARQAQELLLAGGNVQDLATDSLWIRLTAAAESANEEVRSAARNQWRQFIESRGYVETPSVLDGRMLKTPANESLLETYRQHYAKYSAIVRADLPASASTPDELISVVRTLQGLQEQLKGTAPEAVRLFLKAIESGGASLDLITPEVMEWLLANDDPNRFVVKTKANVSWR